MAWRVIVPKSSGARLGFSLVELVVTITVVGVLAAVAMPRFFDRRDFDERRFYDEVVSAARYAQKYAFTSGCEVQFSINSTEKTYELKQDATNCRTGVTFNQNVEHPGKEKENFSAAAPDGISLSMTPSAVVFIPSGATSDLTTRTVNVGTRSFTIVGATGFVQAP